MRKLLYKVWLCTLLCLPVSQLLSQDATQLSKTMAEQYTVSSGDNIEVKNKYGQIIVNTWGEDLVKVEVTVTAYGKNKAAAEKILNRVSFDFNQVSSYVILETILDRKSGLFKDLLNNIGDYSKTLLSKDRLDVDYELYVPENAGLKIENKFGDVFLGDLKNRCEVTVSNGNLKAHDLSGYADIGVSFGNAYFSAINDGNIELKVADIEIEEANELNINSSSSEIIIHKVIKGRINSRNDKFKIKEIAHFSGKSSFSKIEVGKLLTLTNLDMNYGLLAVSEINDGFTKIQLKGKSTDFNLSFDNQSYFNASLTARKDKLVLPTKISDVDIDYLEDSDSFVSVNGTIGIKNSQPGLVNINAQKGNLKVFFVRTDNYPVNSK